ncbi:MAG: hypothetical protein HC897_03390 [Thermoanaerobaculia bacterium]|nr:hypothetical protein [Thermoanaerobaculia bacterium]
MKTKLGRQHVILCEGYDDRSFWAGWLSEGLACRDPTNKGTKRISDAWNRPVKDGRFLFESPTGEKILIHPFHGRSRARQALGEYLDDVQAESPDLLVLSIDSDATETTGDNVPGRSLFDQIVRERAGSTEISLVLWECNDPHPTPGVPEKQTLERLVSAAIRAAYAGRGEAVERWLDAEPRAESTGPKSYGFSYLAKWYADQGADDFYRAIWRDPDVARELRSRLEASGAWAVAENLARD